MDSSAFKVPAGHSNSGGMKYRSAIYTAEKVSVGDFTLPSFLVARIGGSRALSVDSLETVPEPIRQTAKLSNGGLYFGANPDVPEVGDQRVRFEEVPNGPVSIVAKQAGTTFTPFLTRRGGQVELLEPGLVSATEMFQMAQDRNKMLTLAIRVGGFLLLGMAFSMILLPIAVLASILPFLGRLVGAGTGMIAFLLAGILWTGTVAVAWIFYRPLLGIAILLVTVVLIVLMVKRFRKAGPSPLPDSPPPLS